MTEPRFKQPSKRKPSKAARDRAELKLVRLHLLERSGGRCEVRWSELCTGVGTMAHHIVRRSAGGTNDPMNLVWTCAFDHDLIHANPAEALVRGFLKPGWDA